MNGGGMTAGDRAGWLLPQGGGRKDILGRKERAGICSLLLPACSLRHTLPSSPPPHHLFCAGRTLKAWGRRAAERRR